MPGCLDHLRALVAIDTTNPPRTAEKIRLAIDHARATLAGAGFTCAVTDLGDGCVNLLAERGRSPMLVNCHLDTVPACEGWDSDPFELRVEDGDAIGLGACDVKGSAAAILTAAEQSTGDAAILLTTDEEAGHSDCVRSFLAGRAASGRFTSALVCEPTGCRVVGEHRGLVSVEASFAGTAGHASAGVASTRSAVHDAVRWSAAALDWSESTHDSSRLAIGVIEGGVKTNMIAQSARVRFGIRNRPSANPDDSLTALRALADRADVRWRERFRGPALPPSELGAAIADLLNVGCAPPVDFWTEASLFAGAGIPAVVFGPGSITFAHAANERVPIAELEQATGCFGRLFSNAKGGAK